MDLDIITKSLTGSKNKFNELQHIPSRKIYSYQSSYINNNGETQSLKKKIISDGKTGKIYKNINGKETIDNLNSKDLSTELIFPQINIPTFLTNYRRIPNRYVNNIHSNTNSNSVTQILLFLILILLIYIAVKLNMKK